MFLFSKKVMEITHKGFTKGRDSDGVRSKLHCKCSPKQFIIWHTNILIPLRNPSKKRRQKTGKKCSSIFCSSSKKFQSFCYHLLVLTRQTSLKTILHLTKGLTSSLNFPKKYKTMKTHCKESLKTNLYLLCSSHLYFFYVFGFLGELKLPNE